jgi:endonuclease YncB( thermonuclease family)
MRCLGSSLRFCLVWSCVFIFAVAPVVLASQADEDARIIGEARVIDGDTLDVGPVRIRFHGIDAPEAGQRCGRADGGTWRCGDHATARLAELVDGKEIECAARDRDQYGRIIAVCYVDEVAVNEILVREGLAWAFTRFSEDYVAIEAEARLARIGVWQGEAEAPSACPALQSCIHKLHVATGGAGKPGQAHRLREAQRRLPSAPKPRPNRVQRVSSGYADAGPIVAAQVAGTRPKAHLPFLGASGD